ncbi:MAG: HAMP domain-containing histidine kinase [Chloroflexi bacterium]|nr:HAMP domain-containing histidine kinase [Chloroflexota bacterium]
MASRARSGGLLVALIVLGSAVGVLAAWQAARRWPGTRVAPDHLPASAAAVLAHELRTPLAGLQAILELLQGAALSTEERAAYLDAARWETARLYRLVDDVLGSDAGAAGLPLRRSVCDLGSLIARTVAGLQVAAAAQGVTLLVHVPAGLPRVYADPDRLAQVLINLVQNALQHTPAAGQITVRAERQGARVHVAVQNTGAGIPAADLAQVAAMFQCGAPRSPHGSLGLAISQRIIAQHGGRLWATSQPGQGSTFAFAIPGVPDRP